ncbi:MAG: iron(III) transport system ATP-binding protein [Candidatus Poriferisodalaceae bacterium]
MSNATTPALEVLGAVKRYGSVRAVDDVDLELPSNEILALVGPSGCGKTTLLRSVAGLLSLDEGVIRINGVLVDDASRRLPPEKRRVGLVFQDHSLFPHLSVADNVAFGIRDATRRNVRRRVGEALDVVELGGHHARFPHELSGGERQRVALARALAPRPSLMLLDEPFASLDPNLREQLRSHVVGALRATDTAAVFVTHDQPEAISVGDRVAVMRDGRIEQVNEPSTVFHQPANRFVATFMGEASFLAITQNSHGPTTALGKIDVTTAQGAVAMVRPDDVTFIPDDRGAAVVTETEFRGPTWRCKIELPGGVEILSNRSHLDPLSVGTRGRAELVPGHCQVPIPDAR